MQVDPTTFSNEEKFRFMKGWVEAGGYYGDIEEQTPWCQPWTYSKSIELSGSTPEEWGKSWWQENANEIKDNLVLNGNEYSDSLMKTMMNDLQEKASKELPTPPRVIQIDPLVVNATLIEAHREDFLKALKATLSCIPVDDILEETIEVTEDNTEDLEETYKDFRSTLLYRAMDMVDLTSEVPEFKAILDQPNQNLIVSDFQMPICEHFTKDPEFEKTVFEIICPSILETADDLNMSVDMSRSRINYDPIVFVNRICDELVIDKPKALQNLLEERLGTQADEVVLQMKTKESTQKHQEEKAQVIKRR